MNVPPPAPVLPSSVHQAPLVAIQDVAPPVQPQPPAPPSSNVSDLLQRLINYGIIAQNKTEKPADAASAQPSSSRRPGRNEARSSPVNNRRVKSPYQELSQQASNDPPLKLEAESLKLPRPMLVASLYNGIQCTNCSLRFLPKEMDAESGKKTKYAKHLDWHFRQKRKEQKPAVAGATLKRNWFYALNLWLQFKAIADEDENSNSVFDTDSKDEQQVEEESTVPASANDEDNRCVVCGDRFEPVWLEVEEEWILKNAKIHDGKFVHPICFVDMSTFISTTENDETADTDVAADSVVANNNHTDDNDKNVGDDEVIKVALEMSAVVDDDNVKTEIEEGEAPASDAAIAADPIESAISTAAEMMVEEQEPMAPPESVDDQEKPEMPVKIEDNEEPGHADVKVDDVVESVGVYNAVCESEVRGVSDVQTEMAAESDVVRDEEHEISAICSLM